ncbi:unnamed protein product [Dibothriocephalus latus]|uniref:Peptidase A2 domain-containing protein n=1 Tax=Dibothriocephalus latus TaxID=60516 RepID=A0A3P7LU56_DIBLA|nr:unnamed protein product [Dibothriocephalus latus]
MSLFENLLSAGAAADYFNRLQQQPQQSPAEFASELTRYARMSYPDVPKPALDRMILDRFTAGLCDVPVCIDNHSFQALVDTGASVSLITPSSIPQTARCRIDPVGAYGC